MKLDDALIGKEFVHFKNVDKPGYSGPRFRIADKGLWRRADVRTRSAAPGDRCP